MPDLLRTILDIIRHDRLLQALEIRRECATAVELRDDIVMTVVELLTPSDGRTCTIGFVVGTCYIDECISLLEFARMVLIDREIETSIIRIHEAEIPRSHGEEEFLESIREVMSRISIDGSGIEVDEEVFESHFFHPFYRLLRRRGIHIGAKYTHETIIEVSLSIIIDEIGHKCPDTIDTTSIGVRIFRIEDIRIEDIAYCFCIFFELWRFLFSQFDDEPMDIGDRESRSIR